MESRARVDQAFTGRAAEQEPAEAPLDAQGLQRTLEQRFDEQKADKSPAAQPNRTPARILKALAGIAIIAVFGWLPLQALWQTSSVEAVVNSRLVTLRAPIDGQVVCAPNLSSETRAWSSKGRSSFASSTRAAIVPA